MNMECIYLFELVLVLFFEVMTNPAGLWRIIGSGQVRGRVMSQGASAVPQVGDDGGLHYVRGKELLRSREFRDAGLTGLR